MARRGKKKSVNKDAWLTTYGDMITLVLTFFILLYSMSTISEEKWETIVEAFTGKDSSQIVINVDSVDGEGLPGMQDALNGLAPEEISTEDINDISDLYEYLKSFVQQQGLEEEIALGKGDGFVIMRFRGDLFFGPDTATLLPPAKSILDVLADGLVNLSDDIQLVRIDGHTATNPDLTHYTISTRRLSTDRANAVLEYLEDKEILDPVKLIAVGYGKYRPIASNDTNEGRQQNRRVEVYISEKSSTDINIDEVYKTLAPEPDDH